MLISTEFRALRERKYDAQTAGRFADAQMVRWVRRGDQVHLEHISFEKRAERERDSMHADGRVVRDFLIRTFDVLAEGAGKAPIIDVTPLFLSDLPSGFTQEFLRRFRMDRVDPERSLVDTVKAFPQNVEVTFSPTWNANPVDLAKQPKSEEDAVPASMRFLFQASMLLLPEQPMQGRYADDSQATVPFYAHGSGRAGTQVRAFIQRYRLEKKDPNAAISEPVEPIVFYVGREVPDRWRAYIKQGIEDWQGAFEELAPETPFSPGTHLLCKKMGGGIPMMHAIQSCAGVLDRMGWAGGWLILVAARSSFFVRYSGIACLTSSRACTSPRSPRWMRAPSACRCQIR